MTHLQVTGSYSNEMTVAFWKCKDQTLRDTKFWFKFKGELVKIAIILDSLAFMKTKFHLFSLREERNKNSASIKNKTDLLNISSL